MCPCDKEGACGILRSGLETKGSQKMSSPTLYPGRVHIPLMKTGG